jgi:mannose-1-phosphate guanylyltransferase
MSNAHPVWALVLAGGDGSRLRELTTKPCGTAVPKQFCSLQGGRSLLEEAIERAARVVEPSLISTIVGYQHRQWWSEIPRLLQLSPGNVIVQPRNRGTGIGILYSMLHILAKEPSARVVLLPSDHFVREEAVLQRSLQAAIERVEAPQAPPVLLGLEPDDTDTELGYILPAAAVADDAPDAEGLHTRHVARFVEKPGEALADKIIGSGGLWNTFIIAARAQALVEMFLPRYAALVMEMQVILGRSLLRSGSATADWPTLAALYERLPDLDFSRHLLPGREGAVRVLQVPPCGWSDLGTPRRVGDTLRRLCRRTGSDDVPRSAYINLATQHARFERRRSAGALGANI